MTGLGKAMDVSAERKDRIGGFFNAWGKVQLSSIMRVDIVRDRFSSKA